MSDHSKDRSIPYVLFIVTITAYGLLLPKMGFYWDDWPFIWIARFLGPAEFFPAFNYIRPFLSPIFYLTTSILPPIPIYWQIFALIIRFASGILAWLTFRQVWPQQKLQTLAMALLFLVFPGYSQHWVAFTHVNQEWIPFLFYLLSFTLTVLALRNRTSFIRNTAWALLFLVLGVFPTEYFASIEPLRFLFIWSILADDQDTSRKIFIKSLKLWLPYLLIWLLNIVWLVYFFAVSSYGAYEIELARRSLSIPEILTAFVDTLWKGGIYQWGQVIVLVLRSIRAPSSILTVLLIFISFSFFLLYLRRLQQSENPNKNFAVSAVLIGTIGILLGRLPSFAAGLPLTLQSSNDRFMISMMIGGSIFTIGLVELVLRHIRARLITFALLIALGIGQQFFNANNYRRDWQKQQEILWQMSWRIPALESNTLILTDQLPLDNETDLSLTAPINWMYAPGYLRSAVPYGLIFTEKRIGGSLPSLEPGEEVKVQLRTVGFTGSTSQAIVIYMPENGCLRVLSSEWGDENTYAGKSKYLVGAIPLSNPNLISTRTNQTAAIPFVHEPEHTWCYYYTKAELARQQGDWGKVIELFDEASSLGYKPADPFELLVFIEANAMTGNIEAAEKLSMDAVEMDKKVRKGVCQVWKRVWVKDPVHMDPGTLKKLNETYPWCPQPSLLSPTP